MDRPRPGGTALLVVGPSNDAPALRDAAARSLGQIGETLLASGGAWHIEWLGADGDVVDSIADRIATTTASVAVIAIAGTITDGADGSALLAGAAPPLRLTAVANALAASAIDTAIVVVGGWASDATDDVAAPPASVAEGWLAALASGRAGDLVAVGAGRDAPIALDAVLGGLAGAAVDAGTGTVTLGSLGDHLHRLAPTLALHRGARSPVVVAPAPLAGPWDPRLSRRSLATGPTGPLTSSATDELTGTVLPGRFRLDQALARGGFGTVYRARQLTVERDVAVKVLNGAVDLASPGARLFLHEIQSVARIDHPNVVRIHQADVTPDGRLFFAMELLPGRDLEQLMIDEGPLPPRRAIALVRQLLAGVGAAHDVGLVHADIKPANALVVPGRDGERVALVDFGLSRLCASGSAIKSLGGTPAYMAPEQLGRGRVDARSDLFSVALVLVSLLTGWRRRSPTDLAPPLDGLPPDLRPTLARALAIDPAHRFQSAAELASALAGQAALPAPAPRPRLAAFTEADAGRLHGRDREIAAIVDHVVHGRSALVVGRPGVGITTLLRTGALPRLSSLGLQVVYVNDVGGSDAMARIAGAIHRPARDLGAALEHWRGRSSGRLVVIADHLDEAATAAIGEVIASDARLPTFILAAPAMPPRQSTRHVPPGRVHTIVVDLLDEAGARAAIDGAVAENRLELAPDLLPIVLADLARLARKRFGLAATSTAVYPPDVRAVLLRIFDELPAGEAVVTPVVYQRCTRARPAAAPPARTSRRAAAPLLVASALVIAGVVSTRRGDVPSSATTAASITSRPAIVVGGSGTVLWGFLQPVQTHLETAAAVTVPLDAHQDRGSGGALRALRRGELDVAALSRRIDTPLAPDLRITGQRLVEVAIGHDETAFFVHPDNPIAALDRAALRRGLCCGRGKEMGPLTWRDLGVATDPLAGRPVRWIVFGRNGTPRPGDTTSSTLSQADQWICDQDLLCPATLPVELEAHEVLRLVPGDPTALALSSRSFATVGARAVAAIDTVAGIRLDGRKALWLYAAAPADRPLPAPLCRFLDAVLGGTTHRLLAAGDRAHGLPDELRRRQRIAIGLDDGTCLRRPLRDLPDAGGDAFVARSPIGDDVEVDNRWVP
jgi:hypothetical protein